MLPLRISEAARRTHVDSMRLLLEAERLALGNVARAAIQATSGFLRSLGDVVAAAHRLETSLVDPLTKARQGGRAASLRGIQAEYAVARREAIKAGINPFSMPLVLPAGGSTGDVTIALRNAKELADAFLQKATKSFERADGASISGRSALPVYAIEEKATTQTAESFSDERVQVERRVVLQHSATNWLPLLVKIWDATLDVRTCPVCREMDHQHRPLGLDFTGGRVPAMVHRRCRCIQITVFAPIYLGREERETA